jgi:hypothetical protein
MDKEDQILAMLKEIRDLLGDRPTATTAPRRGGQRRAETGRGTDVSRLDRLMQSQKDASEWHAVWDNGKPLDKWLAVLAVADTELGNNSALSASEIAQVAKDRFRLRGVHTSNVNRDLKRERRYIGSVKRGGGHEYRLTRDGVTYIHARRDELGHPAVSDTTTRRRSRKTRPPGKVASTKTRANSRTNSARVRKAARSRPGPKAMLEDLIAKGYFKTARTITELQEHLQRQRGHRYTAQDLSPALVRLLRSGALSRDTNADGTYEYQAG